MPPRSRSTSSSRSRAARAKAGRSWREAKPAPVVTVSGPESLLADRAVARITAALRGAHPDLSVTAVDASTYEAGTLGVLASPSLFGEERLVVMENLAEATDAAQRDLLDYVETPDDTVTLVVIHNGAAKARNTLEKVASAAGTVSIDVPAMKRDDERLAFVAGEFDDAKRRISSGAAQALVDAFGSDLRELASSCSQLLADVEGDVDEDAVRRYYGGRAEATGFEVADAIASRDQEESLLALRRALSSGVDPIPLVAAIAARLRTMAKVSAVQGSGGQVASELGMAPWMVDKARRELRRWTPGQLGEALVTLADVDVALKGGVVVKGLPRGGSHDNLFTLERAVMTMTAPGDDD